MDGEAPSSSGDVVEGGRGEDDLRAVGRVADRHSEWVEYFRQVVIITESVGSRAVCTDHNSLVLNGSGDKEMSPGISSRYGPVGRDEEHVVSMVGVSAPNGESKVVTNNHRDFPAFIIDSGHVLATGGEDARFLADAEEVALIVVFFGSVEAVDNKTAVEEMPFVGDIERSADEAIPFVCDAAESG